MWRPPQASALRAVCQMRDRHPWYAYEDDEGVVLGDAKAGPFADPREEACGRTCEVSAYVAEGAHRRGIGRKLYDAVLSESAKHCHSAVARITLPNPAAIALHERCGFRRVGTLVGGASKSGAWHDVDLWQKVLGGAPK